jgi:hypothetical protein
MASVLVRTLGGAKAPDTRFTYATPAPTMTFAGTREKPATAPVDATASVATAATITLCRPSAPSRPGNGRTIYGARQCKGKGSSGRREGAGSRRRGLFYLF